MTLVGFRPVRIFEGSHVVMTHYMYTCLFAMDEHANLIKRVFFIAVPVSENVLLVPCKVKWKCR